MKLVRSLAVGFVALASLQQVYAQTTACTKTSFDACSCSASGIVAGVDTKRPGCKQHIAGSTPFCYVDPSCPFPEARVSQLNSPAKYIACEEASAVSNDKCDAPTPPPTPPPSPCKAESDGVISYPETPIGSTAVVSCPSGQYGSFRRVCGDKGVWGKATGSCTKPTCTDKQMNGNEEGIDCGGDCPKCSFCSTVTCGSFGTCDAAASQCTCSNGYSGDRCQNPPPSKCAGRDCSNNGVCIANTGLCECYNGYSGGKCETPPSAGTCYDGIQNGPEGGVDCLSSGTTDSRPEAEACMLQCNGYHYVSGEWGQCSEACGGGVQTRPVKCVDGSGKTVPPINCEDSHPTPSTQKCNLEPCPTRAWVAHPWKSCDSNCNGYQVREVVCVSSVGAAVVADALCKGTKPASRQTCNPAGTCTADSKWSAGEWSKCSHTCGGGTQTRAVTCGGGTCNSAVKPASSAVCNLDACIATTHFAPCGWDECTSKCNGGSGMVGERFREMHCREGVEADGKPVDLSLCADKPRPQSYLQGCNTQECKGYNWMADSPGWGPCIAGTQTRSFHCHSSSGANAEYADCQLPQSATVPNPAGPQPPTQRACSVDMCAAAPPSPSSPTPSADGSPASTTAPSAALFAILALFGTISSSSSSVHAKPIVAAVLIASLSLASAVPATTSHHQKQEQASYPVAPAKAHHYHPVTNFVMEQGSHNPGVSKSGHATPYAHSLAVSFNACGRDFKFSQLQLMDGLLTAEHHPRETELVSYSHPRSKEQPESASFVLFGHDQLFAVVISEDDVYTIAPAFMIDDHQAADFKDGGKAKMYCTSENDINPALQGQASRRLLQANPGFVTKDVPASDIFKSTCFNGFAQGYKFKLGMAVDAGWADKVGAANVESYSQALIAAANAIYTTQVHTSLVIGPTKYLKTLATGDPSWNEKPATPGRVSCGLTVNGKLNAFTSWRGAQGKNAGIWHLMTHCFPPPGTVGLAYVGVLGNTRVGTGWTSHLGSRTWMTFSHEVGHNFNGPHSFEYGQGSTGGIMDYGRGMTDKPWFNKQLRENDICSGVARGLSTAGPNVNGWGTNAFEAGMISPNGPTPPPTTPPAPTPNPNCAGTISANKYSQCGMWAKTSPTPSISAPARNHCSKNAAWMYANCQKACCDSINLEAKLPAPHNFAAAAPAQPELPVKPVCGDHNCQECTVDEADGNAECSKCANDLVPSPRGGNCVSVLQSAAFSSDMALVPFTFKSNQTPAYLVLDVDFVVPESDSDDKAVVLQGKLTNGLPFSLAVVNSVPVFTIEDFEFSALEPVPAGKVVSIKLGTFNGALSLHVPGQPHLVLTWPKPVPFGNVGIESWNKGNAAVVERVQVQAIALPANQGL
mmetsp:Transcript_17310/g.33759  ORF Transcript_17310/g.33759 Transcript_17310/m.33759 type:complete len:1367 (+) Transcript_17310:33-4133(+)|eukprot:CAMPEP_0175139402 /NCGR_PEP_ID=MMETSP0087-20121206/10880_1 /TAXON_ID=136419 /ORGANISM="Unknown Unknown, Strain D1" /LENGTH=1366 /DNA_ID=CAMNT_0016422403 /DNA_START=33 /DNA_END=4133 /DNA_ORIENTATION=-